MLLSVQWILPLREEFLSSLNKKYDAQNLPPQDMLQIKGQILSLTQNHNQWLFVNVTKKGFPIYVPPFTIIWRES